MKIKLVVFFCITLFACAAFGQAPVDTSQTKMSDSTRVKLDQYKKLYDSGVIGEDEYNKMKNQLLGNSVVPETKQQEQVKSDVIITRVDTMPMQALKERYKGKVIAGSVILSVGVGFLVGDALYGALSPKPPALNGTNADTISSEKSTHIGSEVALGVLGGLATIGGSVFLALGLKDKAVYRRRGKELTMNFTGKTIEVALVF